MRLSIVIPTLDDASSLRRHLPSALREGDEVVVSDGGSRDDTGTTARGLGAEVVEGPAQRGAQLNRGAARASGEILLFLHADTNLPEGAAEAVRRAIAGGAVGGGFELCFDTAHPTLERFARRINWRTRWSRCPLGDQAHFVRRQDFDALGGYREWPLFEDLDFARRLKRRGPIAVLVPPVVTSARRYLEKGPWRNVARNWLLFALYFLGIPPPRLEGLYRPRRPDRPPHGPGSAS